MKRVLIVEDSPTIATYLRLSFGMEGDDCIVVDSDFRALLNENHPIWTQIDGVVCDLMLPDVNGWDILAVAAKHHPNVRLVLFTAADVNNLPSPPDLTVHVIGKGAGVPFQTVYDALHD